MVDKCKVFEEAVKNALMTEKMRHFRLCIDEKDNISIAKGGGFLQVCPSNTKKILDIVITPGIVKT